MFYRHSEIVVLISALFALPAQGQQGVVELRLLATPSSVCAVDQELRLEGIVTNTSEHPVEIATNTLDSGIDLALLKNGKEADWQHIVKDSDPNAWRKIEPHQSVIIAFSENLSPDAMLMRRFGEPGMYEIQTRFSVYLRANDGTVKPMGFIRSNKVIFILSECAPPNRQDDTAPGPAVELQVQKKDSISHESGHSIEAAEH